MKTSPNPQGPMYRLGQMLGVLLMLALLLGAALVIKLLVVGLLA